MVLAGIGIVLAAAAPTLRARGFDARVEEAATRVESLRAASERYFAERGSWPTAGAPGELPSEVATAFPGVQTLSFEDYSIQWQQLEMVERREVTPGAISLPGDLDATPDSVGPRRETVPIPIGGIIVRSSDDDLLKALLERYGARTSFVRDSTFMLVVGVTPRG